MPIDTYGQLGLRGGRPVDDGRLHVILVAARSLIIQSARRINAGELPFFSIDEAATLRYSTGNNGAPVRRSSTYTNPYFVIWATASTLRPSRVTVTRLGAAGKSMSHTSCLTP